VARVLGVAHDGAMSKDKRLVLVLALNLSMVLALVIVGLAARSLGVLRLVIGAPYVEGSPVIVVSVIAAVVMGTCALIIGTVETDDLNMRSVLLDTLADGAAAVGVAVSGAIILVSEGLYWLDSAVALAIAVIVAYQALKLIREVMLAVRGGSDSS